MSVMKININKLKFFIKRSRLSVWVKKQNSTKREIKNVHMN